MMACFDRRLDELQALIDVFAMEPEGVADRAVLAVHALSPVDVCVNTQLLTAEIPLPRTAGARVEAHSIGLQLARVKALHDAGAYSEAAAEVEGLAGVVDNLDHPPLTAEHRYLSGLLAERLRECR